MKIEFGRSETEWAQYGFAEPMIVFNGEETGFKAIVKEDRLIKVLTDRYHLYPNEEALKVANKAAKLAGLRRFTADTPGMRNEKHVVYSNDGNRMRALFMLKGDHKVDSEVVNLGVNVYNSIDGTTSFGAGLFTFREMCSNGVIWGKQDIRTVRHAHTIGLAKVIEAMKGAMVLLMEEAIGVVESYRRMAQVKVQEDLVNRLNDSYLSKKILPEYVTEKEVALPDVTEWDLYNDVTEAIWHNEKTGLKSKAFQFTTLHKIMPLVPRRI